MAAILISALFAVSGIFAIASLLGSWRRYGGAFRHLRAALRECPASREVRVTVREVRVHSQAVVLRPAFKGPARSPSPARGLPAAA